MKKFRYFLLTATVLLALFYAWIFSKVVFLNDDMYVVLDVFFLLLIALMLCSYVLIIIYDVVKDETYSRILVEECRMLAMKNSVSPAEIPKNKFISNCTHLFGGKRKNLRRQLASLKERNEALTDELKDEKQKHADTIRRNAMWEIKQCFSERRNMNHLKLKVLVRIAQEVDKHAFSLGLDDVIELLRKNRLHDNEMWEYQHAFNSAMPKALERIQRVTSNSNKKVELYFMMVALRYSESEIMAVLSMGPDGVEKMRRELCDSFNLPKSHTELVDIRIRQVMLPDEDPE